MSMFKYVSKMNEDRESMPSVVDLCRCNSLSSECITGQL